MDHQSSSTETPPGPARPEAEGAQHASDTASSRPSSPSRRHTRSCHLCHSRKVGCDKRKPCSRCSRAGKPCVYPAEGEPVRRPRKTTMADVASRISSLEKSLTTRGDPHPSEAISSRRVLTPSTNTTPQPPSAVSPSRSPPSTDASRPWPEDGDSGDGVLVQSGPESRYFDDMLLSRVIREQDDIKSAFASPRSRDPQPPTPSPFNLMGILSAPCPYQAPWDYHPTKPTAVRLWSIYLDRVESCGGFKSGHVPSMEAKIYGTVQDPSAAPLDDLALSYSVYLATLVSLEDHEVAAFMGAQKIDLMTGMKKGFEQALAHADFLNRPTITSLHAMGVYLVSVLAMNPGPAIWTLNGLAIRVAQTIGVHCNGERLGLSPFESELRRRLWWHFKTPDSRSGEDHGLRDSTWSQWQGTRLPLNVEDADLYPEMKELPPPRKSFTAMTFSLNKIDICMAGNRLTALATSSTLPSEEERLQIVNDVSARVEERLRWCNPVIPRHRYAALVSRLMLRKVDLVSRQHWEAIRFPSTRQPRPKEEDLVDALEVLESHLRIYTDELVRQFAWAAKAYPQYQMVMYVLWHLCVAPEGPSVDRAWRVVNMALEGYTFDRTKVGSRLRSAVLDVLHAKAREIHQKRLDGDSEGEARTRGSFQTQVATDFAADLPTSWTSGGDFLGDPTMDGFLPWETFIRGFQLDNQTSPERSWI